MPPYEIKVKSYVDLMIIYKKYKNGVSYLGQAVPKEDYDITVEHKTFVIDIPEDKDEFDLLVQLFGYGMAGTADYKINDLLSIPLDQYDINKHMVNTIIVNTPKTVCGVFIEIGYMLSEYLGIPKKDFIRLYEFDKNKIDQADDKSKRDFMAMGIDPIAKNWIAQIQLNPIPDIANIQDNLQMTTVHCYTLSMETVLKYST